jgi:signal peptidase I
MKLWIPATALALVLSPLAFVHPLRVTGRSMMPALKDGSVCLALRAWCSPAPKRGEVWLVESPDGPAVKRIVALPGEHLEQRQGDLWLEEKVLDEPYVEHPERGEGGPWAAGDGFLLLGDNRPESRDGRTWGPLPRTAFRSRILGL